MPLFKPAREGEKPRFESFNKGGKAMATKDDGIVTVKVKFDSNSRKVLEDLKKKAGAESVTDVIRDALRLYKWYLDIKLEGETICLRKEDKTREIELLF